MEHPGEPNRLACLDPVRHDVLGFEVDRVTDADAVVNPVVADVDRRSFDAEHLAHERGQGTHRTSELPGEDLYEFVGLLVRRAFIDEDAELPVPLGHDLRRLRDRGDLETADVRTLDLAVADVEDESDATVVVGRAVVERRVAGADQVARAGLHIAAFEVPGHEVLLRGMNGTRFSGLTRRVSTGTAVRGLTPRCGRGIDRNGMPNVRDPASIPFGAERRWAADRKS